MNVSNLQSQAATHESTRGFIELLEILFVVIEKSCL